MPSNYLLRHVRLPAGPADVRSVLKVKDFEICQYYLIAEDDHSARRISFHLWFDFENISCT